VPRTSLTSRNFNSRWKALRRPYQHVAPKPWRRWLTDRGSLTQHLIRASHGHFRVEVVQQGFAKPSLSEARALSISPRQRTLIREVQLIGDGTPWVFARTVIPVTTLTGRQRQLHHIGNRSLGTILFRDPTMRRGPLQISCLKDQLGQQMWARRSVFWLQNKPLLVAEVFLPPLQQVEYSP